MKSFASLTISVPLAISLAAAMIPSLAETPGASPSSATSASYGRLPLSFEANQGQADPSVQFLSHGQGYTLFLRPFEAVLTLANPRPATAKDPLAAKRPLAQPPVLHIKLRGANAKASATREGEQITKTNYFLGNDSTQWHTKVPNYSRVRYSSVYPGIDLVYYGNHRRLEHDFAVAPNADPGKIDLSFEGMKTLAIDHTTGDIFIKTTAGDIRLFKPIRA